MREGDAANLEARLERIRAQAVRENIRITQHAQQEMVEESITLDGVLQAVTTAHILENYPKHRRGACCLLNGLAVNGRSLHIVCTTAQEVLIIITAYEITAYEPKPPRWITPTQRGQQQ